jgi:hypothetical protein
MNEKKDINANEIKKLEREMLGDKYMSALRKVQFINELKSGLGNEIKANAGKVKIIKKTWFEKLTIALKKIFTNF